MLEFMGLSVLIVRTNEAFPMHHFEAYKSVLEKFSLLMATGDKIYASRFSRQFYPAEERALLRKKWISADQLELS
jgi:hypothetical protein